MDTPRLKTHMRVAAQMRQAQAGGAFATVARRGDGDAGTLYVKLYLGSGKARLFAESRNLKGQRVWHEPLDNICTEKKIDTWLTREADIDPDLWIIEIEDREGRAFLPE